MDEMMMTDVYKSESPTEYLQHYGVPGMKWGVRRTPAQLGHKTPAKRALPNGKTPVKNKSATKVVKEKKLSKRQQKKLEKAQRNKKTRDMTDEEIQTRMARLKLERDYNQLVGENKDLSTSAGKKYVVGILKKIGENTAINLGTQAANHFIGKGINLLFKVDDNDALNRIVNPQKGQSDKK